MNFELNEEHNMIRDAARDFAQAELLPGVIDRDEHQIFPVEQIKKLGELGEISHINSQTNQNLIYVIKGDTDFCFPMHKEFIKELNIKDKIMKVVIPKELLKLN